jgi:adenylate cyclase
VDGADQHDDVADWVHAGLYDPAADGAADRLAVLRHLVDRGATLDQLVEAHELGSLPAVGGDLVRSWSAAREPLADLAARAGVSIELAERVLLAAGLPTGPEADAPERLVVLLEAFASGAALLGEEAVLAFTRVLGAAAANIAEAAVALFYAEMGPGAEREGADELARAQLAEAATSMFGLVPDVLAAVVLARFDRTSRRAQQRRGWTAPGVDPDVVVDAASEVVALGFVDLVGSTEWAEELSLREHSLALSRFESAAWAAAVLAGGRVVKTIGDEVFFSAPTLEVACRIGLELCRFADADATLPAARGAVGVGAVSSREGDYFGPLVNQVARMVKEASAGEIVVASDVASTLPPASWAVRDLGSVELRGVAGPVAISTVEQIA